MDGASSPNAEASQSAALRREAQVRYVIDLDKAYQTMDSDAPLPHQSDIDRVNRILKLNTWRYEDAPVLTIDEVKATTYDPLAKRTEPVQGGESRHK